jgi:hypothetical protein
MNNSEVKDKQALIDARRNIEQVRSEISTIRTWRDFVIGKKIIKLKPFQKKDWKLPSKKVRGVRALPY